MRNRAGLLSKSFLAVFVLPATLIHAISVREIGWFPPMLEGRVWDVSNNGFTAGNQLNHANSSYLGWVGNPSGEIQFLGDLPGGDVHSAALGVSGNGSTVVGISAGTRGYEAFRWTSLTGMQGLGSIAPPERFGSGAWAANSDGSVIVGWSASASGQQAFRWTAATGMVGLGDLPGGGEQSIALDVSADGRSVAGYGYSNGNEAFLWTETGGMVGLGHLAGYGPFPNSEARAISANGNVVVGYSGGSGAVGEAFRWTLADGMVGLGDLPGSYVGSRANDVSGNGEVIVGLAISDRGGEAFVWDEASGMQSIHAMLASAGIDFSNWFNTEFFGISENGRYAAGIGYKDGGHFRAFLVDFEDPSNRYYPASPVPERTGAGAFACTLIALALVARGGGMNRTHRV